MTYQEKIAKLVVEGKFPKDGVHQMEVAHDDDCKLISRTGACNCDPDIYIKGEKIS